MGAFPLQKTASGIQLVSEETHRFSRNCLNWFSSSGLRRAF